VKITSCILFLSLVITKNLSFVTLQGFMGNNGIASNGMMGPPPMANFMKPHQSATATASPTGVMPGLAPGSMPRNASTPNLDAKNRDPFADLGKNLSCITICLLVGRD